MQIRSRWEELCKSSPEAPSFSEEEVLRRFLRRSSGVHRRVPSLKVFVGFFRSLQDLLLLQMFRGNFR